MTPLTQMSNGQYGLYSWPGKIWYKDEVHDPYIFTPCHILIPVKLRFGSNMLQNWNNAIVISLVVFVQFIPKLRFILYSQRVQYVEKNDVVFTHLTHNIVKPELIMSRIRSKFHVYHGVNFMFCHLDLISHFYNLSRTRVKFIEFTF